VCKIARENLAAHDCRCAILRTLSTSATHDRVRKIAFAFCSNAMTVQAILHTLRSRGEA
jgi:hypothetical protein